MLMELTSHLLRAYAYAKECVDRREGNFLFWQATNGRWPHADREWIKSNMDLSNTVFYSPETLIRMVERRF